MNISLMKLVLYIGGVLRARTPAAPSAVRILRMFTCDISRIAYGKGGGNAAPPNAVDEFYEKLMGFDMLFKGRDALGIAIMHLVRQLRGRAIGRVLALVHNLPAESR